MKPANTVTRRLSQHARRKMIVEQSIRFFAEKGFAATTRELAERIGVSQPLLFQHFPTKNDLIEAVFSALFERMSSYDWFERLQYPGTDLRTRLIEFFRSYAITLYDYHWIRIYMFAGLEGGTFNRLCISKLTEPLLRTIAVEIRRSYGIGRCKPEEVSPREIELLWILHGGLYYSAIRKQIYGMEIESIDVRPLIEYGVDGMLSGMQKLLSDMGEGTAKPVLADSSTRNIKVRGMPA